MNIKDFHEWPDNPDDAMKIQQRLKERLLIEKGFAKLEYITAVDTAFSDRNNHLYAAAVTIRLPELIDIERTVAEMEVSFPYIPALLGFREGPVILRALSRLTIDPDVLIFSGHGIAHPRGIGIASHLGILTDTASIGCARKLLCGDYLMPATEQGSISSLFVANVEAGYAYRTKENVKPMFISPGHKCSIRDALDVVEKCLTGYRMPEPQRLAHLFANKYKQVAARNAEPEEKKSRRPFRKPITE